MKIASLLMSVSLEITRLSWVRENQANGCKLRICFGRNIIRYLTRWESWRSIREVLSAHFLKDAFRLKFILGKDLVFLLWVIFRSSARVMRVSFGGVPLGMDAGETSLGINQPVGSHSRSPPSMAPKKHHSSRSHATRKMYLSISRVVKLFVATELPEG
jgi:hypothetical protein